MSDESDGDWGTGAPVPAGSLFPARVAKAAAKGKMKGKRKGKDIDAEGKQVAGAGKERQAKPKRAEEEKQTKGTPFGGGGAKFAEAFTSILRAAGEVESAAGPATGSAVAAPVIPTMLGRSRTVQRKAEEEREERLKRKQQRKKKRELKAAGHAPPKPRGLEPERDALERRLLVTATRGVVQLFNAVAKVQRAQKDADETGAKPAKTSFVEELKRAAAAAAAPGGAGAGAGTGARGRGAGGEDAGAGPTGWDVLKEGFGLSRAKLKDWDGDKDGGEDSEGGLSDSDIGDDD